MNDETEEKNEREEVTTKFEDACEDLKDTLGNKVRKVVIIKCTDSPCVLVTGTGLFQSHGRVSFLEATLQPVEK